jgi:hypothetical protein
MVDLRFSIAERLWSWGPVAEEGTTPLVLGLANRKSPIESRQFAANLNWELHHISRIS